MFIHVCPPCELDCHHACWEIKPAPPGYMGGSMCICEDSYHKEHKFVEVKEEQFVPEWKPPKTEG